MRWRNATEIFRMLKEALGKQKMGQTGCLVVFQVQSNVISVQNAEC
jgi:hypothetical protein